MTSQKGDEPDAGDDSGAAVYRTPSCPRALVFVAGVVSVPSSSSLQDHLRVAVPFAGLEEKHVPELLELYPPSRAFGSDVFECVSGGLVDPPQLLSRSPDLPALRND